MTGWCIFGVVSYIEYFIVYFLKIFLHLSYGNIFFSLQLAAAPFALGALFLPYPWCFLSLLPSNIIGEMWIGVTTALVIDLAPSRVRTGAVSIYLFIITLIGGNFNLVVTPILNAIKTQLPYLLSLRITLSVTFPGVYALSSLLFIVTFFLMRSDLRRKARLEEEDKANKLV